MSPSSDIKRCTLSTTTTGSSVLAITYQDGVMVAVDTTASYGSNARFKGISRYASLNSSTLFTATGEYSDFQALVQRLQELAREDWVHQDQHTLQPSEFTSYAGRILYQRRSKMNPLWVQAIIAGIENKEPYLAYVDLHGTSFKEQTIATGFGKHFCIGELRAGHRADMTEEEAYKLLENCMRNLYYRDTLACSEIQIAKITVEQGISISNPIQVSSTWHASTLAPN